MKIIVDANIVFSAILNTNSKIGDLLINSNDCLTFIAPEFLRNEIHNHYSKLIKISGLTLPEIKEAEFQIYKTINFISEEEIPVSCWKDAAELVKEIDPKDTHYIAYSKHFNCKIWSGDKILIIGLKEKGFTDFVNVKQLSQLREQARQKTKEF